MTGYSTEEKKNKSLERRKGKEQSSNKHALCTLPQENGEDNDRKIEAYRRQEMHHHHRRQFRDRIIEILCSNAMNDAGRSTK